MNHAKPLNYEHATVGAINALSGQVTIRVVVIGLEYETALLRLWQAEQHNHSWGDRPFMPNWTVNVWQCKKIYP